jgi:hypothetical protein
MTKVKSPHSFKAAKLMVAPVGPVIEGIQPDNGIEMHCLFVVKNFKLQHVSKVIY